MRSTDLHGIERAPRELQEYITIYGGKTPFNEPTWRLVLASTVYWKIAGNFKIWDKNLSATERGGIDVDHGGRPFDNKPIRVESGMKECRKYPHIEGWILQKWFPPSSYPKEQWFATENCMSDGTPKCGPYPYEGEYEMIYGPQRTLPSKAQLQTWIQAYTRNREELKPLEQRQRDAQEQADADEILQDQRMENEVNAYMRDKCSYVKSSSPEAGRIRSEKARQCGITEHVGA